MTALATIAAIETRLGLEIGSLQGADLARANAALDDASALVRAEAGKPWITEEGIVIAPPEVITIVIKASIREFKNPDGFSTEQLGDYSYRTENTGGVYLTDEERRIIRNASGSGAHGVWSPRTPSAYGDKVILAHDYYMGDLES